MFVELLMVISSVDSFLVRLVFSSFEQYSLGLSVSWTAIVAGYAVWS